MEAWLFFTIIRHYQPADSVTISDHLLQSFSEQLDKPALESSNLANQETLILTNASLQGLFSNPKDILKMFNIKLAMRSGNVVS